MLALLPFEIHIHWVHVQSTRPNHHDTYFHSKIIPIYSHSFFPAKTWKDRLLCKKSACCFCPVLIIKIIRFPLSIIQKRTMILPCVPFTSMRNNFYFISGMKENFFRSSRIIIYAVNIGKTPMRIATHEQIDSDLVSPFMIFSQWHTHVGRDFLFLLHFVRDRGSLSIRTSFLFEKREKSGLL